MTISAKQVMDLRAATGMPMMKCKKALEAEGGDYEKAVERLRKDGLKAAEKRADRATAEGLVCVRIADSATEGTMVSVLCETEPVRKTPMFREFVDRLTEQAAAEKSESVEALLARPWIDDASTTVADVLAGLVVRIGENMRLSTVAHLQLDGTGRVGSYVHTDGKSGAMVALAAKSSDGEVADVAKDLSMHIVWGRPSALNRDEIPADIQAKELAIARAQVAEDPKMAGKPEQVLEKIIEGKLTSFFRDTVLTEQAWFRDQGTTVGAVLTQHGVTVQAFHRAQVGG